MKTILVIEDQPIMRQKTTTILKMEEGHHDWAKKQRIQIQQMGLENYLSNQAGGGD